MALVTLLIEMNQWRMLNRSSQQRLQCVKEI